MSMRLEQNQKPERVWVAINSTQCNSILYDSLLVGEGVEVYETDRDRWLTRDMAVCEACFCPTGWTEYFKIDKVDVPSIRARVCGAITNIGDSKNNCR